MAIVFAIMILVDSRSPEDGDGSGQDGQQWAAIVARVFLLMLHLSRMNQRPAN